MVTSNCLPATHRQQMSIRIVIGTSARIAQLAVAACGDFKNNGALLAAWPLLLSDSGTL